MNNEYNFILFLAWSFFLQSLSLLNRRSQRQQTSADRQNTEVYFEYCLSRWMHIIRRITAVAFVSLGVHSWFNFVPFVSFVVKPKYENKPNGMFTKPHSKLNNGDFGKFTKPFYAKQTQWYVIAMEYEPPKNTKNAKRTQS